MLRAIIVVAALFAAGCVPATSTGIRCNTAMQSDVMATDEVCRWMPLVEVLWPADEVGKALRIIWCESRGYSERINPSSGTTGLFQVHPGNLYTAQFQPLIPLTVEDPRLATDWSYIVEWLKEPVNNVRAAHMIWAWQDNRRAWHADWACAYILNDYDE